MNENLDCVFIVRNLELFKKKAIKNGDAKDLLRVICMGMTKRRDWFKYGDLTPAHSLSITSELPFSF